MTGRTLILTALFALLVGAGFVTYDAVFVPTGLAPDATFSGVGDAGDGVTLVAGAGTARIDDPERDASAASSAEAGRREIDAELLGEAPRRGRARPILEVTGRIVDRAGAPVPGAELQLSVRAAYARRPAEAGADLSRALRSLADRPAEPTGAGKRESGTKPTLHTGADGSFRLRTSGYREFRVDLSASHAGFAPTRVQAFGREGEETVPFGDVVLETGGAAMGSVVDEDQDPIEGAVVRFVPVPESLVAPPDPASPVAGRPAQVPAPAPDPFRQPGQPAAPTVFTTSRGTMDLVAPVRTGADGIFELEHLPPGPFVLLVDKPRHLPAVTAPRVMASDASLACGRVVLPVGATISGIVLDQQAQPISGVTVEARRESNGTSPSREALRRGRFEGGSRAPGSPDSAGTRGSRGSGGSGSRNRRHPGPESVDSRAVLQDLAVQALRRTTQTDATGAYVIEGLPRDSLRFTFRHASYIDEGRGPVSPQKTSTLNLRMYPTLSIAGRLLSRVDGRPVETYGIVARRIGGEPAGSAGTKNRQPALPEQPARTKSGEQKRSRKPKAKKRPAGRKASRFQESLKERARRLAREQARQAAARARELARQRKEEQKRQELLAIETIRRRQAAYVRDRLGPTGQMPKSQPRPKPHEEGAFRLEGLQPGTYVLDIIAPGHVKLSAGPVQLARGQRPLSLTLHAEPGVTFAGRILDRKDGKPIPGAQVELRLPPLDVDALTASPTVRAKIRPMRSTDLRVERARTDREGRFTMPGLRPGVFQLHVRAKHHREHLEPALVISARPGQERTVLLVRSASVRGTLTGREAGVPYSVALVGEENTASARVDPATGAYEVPTLEPDRYYTLVRRGDVRDGRREKAELAARRKRGFHDLVAHAGSQLVHDVDANATALGALRGRVYHNGQEAAGFTVQLVPESESGTASKRTSNSSQLRAVTDAKAGFRFAYLEPGRYTLEVTPPRARSWRGGPWHRESIVVHAGQAVDRGVQVQTGDLRFRVLHATTGLPVESARIELAPADAVGNRPPKEWRRLRSVRRTSIRDGSGAVRDLMPGRYVYRVSGSGLASETLRISVGTGEVSVRVQVAPKTKKKSGPGKKGQKPT